MERPNCPPEPELLQIEPITRTCAHCKVPKPLSGFHKNKQVTMGHDYRCKPCALAYKAEYAKLPDVREHRKAYRQRPEIRKKHSQEYCKRYYNRPGIKEKRRIYRRQWAAQNTNHIAEYKKIYSKKNPNAFKAHQAVRRALKTGELTRPKHCQTCKKPCKPEGHHWKGYDPKHYLDVQWLCRPCHRAAHAA